jgi:hypothetical protein
LIRSYEAVSSAVKELTTAILGADVFSENNEITSKLLPTEPSFTKALSLIVDGDGCGQGLVVSYFDKVLADTIKESEVRAALAMMKSTGDHRDITQAALNLKDADNHTFAERKLARAEAAAASCVLPPTK